MDLVTVKKMARKLKNQTSPIHVCLFFVVHRIELSHCSLLRETEVTTKELMIWMSDLTFVTVRFHLGDKIKTY